MRRYLDLVELGKLIMGDVVCELLHAIKHLLTLVFCCQVRQLQLTLDRAVTASRTLVLWPVSWVLPHMNQRDDTVI